MSKSLISALLLYLGLSFAIALADDCANPATVEEIAEGVYVRPGKPGELFVDNNFANVGFVVGRDCVAVIDNGASLQEGEALRCAIAKATTVPVCYVIITHHHYDHNLGSLAFKKESVQFIGHAKLARSLSASAGYYLSRLAEASGQDMPQELIVLPQTTVAVGQPMEIDLGGRRLRITAHEPAHTNNDLSIFDYQTRTLWLSDLLFVNHIPTLDGSISGWIATVDALQTQAAAHAVPGHGPIRVDWPAAADAQQRYFNTVRDEARVAIEKGDTLEQAAETVGASERANWQMFDVHHKRNVIKAYTELEWE